MQNSDDSALQSNPPASGIQNLNSAEQALIDELSKGKGKKYVRFVMAAMGSIPWIGSYLSILGAVAGLSAEFDQDKINGLLKLWIEEHRPKLDELGKTLDEIFTRLDNLGEEVQKRIESPEYLALVRKSFRSWDEADTADKREYIKRLISNAGATNLCPDDQVRLFISWIDTYHESHFIVIREIYKNPGITRGQIWDNTNQTQRPPDNSSQAGLFAYLIRQLSMGGIIHQEKDSNSAGQYLRGQRAYRGKGSASSTMESPFEDTKPYVLTELGKEFVHYVLSDVVQRVEASTT